MVLDFGESVVPGQSAVNRCVAVASRNVGIAANGYESVHLAANDIPRRAEPGGFRNALPGGEVGSGQGVFGATTHSVQTRALSFPLLSMLATP